MPTFTPVDFDPFAGPPAGGVQTVPGQNGAPTRVIMDMGQPSSGPRLVPVDHDPFAEPTMASDIAKSAGVGVAKGALGMAGAAGDLRSYLSLGVDAAARKLGVPAERVQSFKDAIYEGMTRASVPTSILANAPTTGDLQGQVEKVTGPFFKPQTTAGEYAQTAGEFLPAAFGGEMSWLARGARVLGPAVASETAGQATKGRDIEPVARFLGALAGGGVTAAAERPGSASRSVANQLPEGVTPQMVDQAEALMGRARQQGIDLSWPEALSQVAQRPVLTNTLRHLEAAPQTEAQMAEFFGRRPQQVEQAARGQFDQFAPANYAPSTIGRQVGRAAEGEITDMRQAINATSQPYYDAAALTPIPAADMARVRAVPGYEIARREIQNDPQLRRYVQGLPENSVGYVNEIKKYLDQAAENAAGPMNVQRNQQRAAGFGQDAALMRDTAIRNSADYETALEIQRVGREQFLQPLLDGYIGKLASRDTTTQNAINALFPKNPLPNSQAEIADTVGRLAQRNQRAASDLVRAHIESTFNQAAKDLQTGPNQAGGAKFRVQLIANPQARANLQAAVEALPNGADRWQGFNRFLDILEATGTRQGIGSRTAYNDMINEMQKAGGVVQTGAKVAAQPLSFLRPLADKYDQWKLGKNLSEVARILTDPRSANMLRALVRTRDGGRSAALAVRLLTYANASR